MEGRHASPPTARSRVNGLLMVLATVCGVWFGITAPDVSPVTPGAVPGLETAVPGGAP